MSTKRFDAFIPFVLKWEGDTWEDDKDDPGNFTPSGELRGTKYGIDARSHPKVDIKNLTEDQAKTIYYDAYWKPNRCELLAFKLGESHFDACVNCGAGRAKKFLAASEYQPSKYNDERRAFYRRLVQARPVAGKYLRGWERRVDDLNQFLGIS